MFIKLNYTANKQINTVFRTIADIVNTPSVTSIAALRTRAIAAGYDSSLLLSLHEFEHMQVNKRSLPMHIKLPLDFLYMTQEPHLLVQSQAPH
jgi:hypothetical protein